MLNKKNHHTPQKKDYATIITTTTINDNQKNAQSKC